MKTRFGLCAALILASAALLADDAAAPKKDEPVKPASKVTLKQGQSIVFDGDSLTSRRTPPSLDNWPYLRLMRWERTYADRVAEWLFCNRPDLKLGFHNAAVGGSSAGECLARYEQFVKPHKPDWVIMTIGGNDSRRKIPLDEFRKNLSDYCVRLKADSNGRLIIVGGFKLFPEKPEDEEIFAERFRYYQAELEVLAANNGVYVDAGTALLEKAGQLVELWPGHTVYSDGGVHTNEVGNEIIANQVLQALGVLKLTE